MRLLIAAAAAALIVPASALGWTWPVAGPVLIGFSFDPAHPYAAGQHRGIDIGAPAGAPELDVPYVYLGIRRAGDEQGYLDPLLFLPASSPGAVEPPADGGEAVPPEPAPVPAAAPPAALAQSA